MKKFIMLSCFLLSAVIVQSQTPWRGFWCPVSDDLFSMVPTTDRELSVDYTPSVWLVRPLVTLSAMQFMLTNPVTVNSFSSIGTGVSYSHFTLANGEPYQNFSANLMILFTNAMESVEPVKLSIAGTVSLWEYLNFGIGYTFEGKHFFIMQGISYNFN